MHPRAVLLHLSGSAVVQDGNSHVYLAQRHSVGYSRVSAVVVMPLLTPNNAHTEVSLWATTSFWTPDAHSRLQLLFQREAIMTLDNFSLKLFINSHVCPDILCHALNTVTNECA